MSGEAPTRTSSSLGRWLLKPMDSSGDARWQGLLAAAGLATVAVTVFTLPPVAAVVIAALAGLMLVRAVQAVVIGVGGRRPEWSSFTVGVLFAGSLAAASIAAVSSWNPGLLSIVSVLFAISFLWDAVIRDLGRAARDIVAKVWRSLNAAALATVAALIAGGLAAYELLAWAGKSDIWTVLVGLALACAITAMSIHKYVSATDEALREMRADLERMQYDLDVREEPR